ncbi:DNA methylase [Halomonas phage QHHSV-1]|nr:DNA methylase [Halomonas phage QHHSV-1]
MADHGNGIALIFARTETAMWFEHIWSQADAVLFLRGRLHFHHLDGTRAEANAGAPSALVAYGKSNARALSQSELDGQLVALKQEAA